MNFLWSSLESSPSFDGKSHLNPVEDEGGNLRKLLIQERASRTAFIREP